jgi:hypothetical protein
VLSGDKQMISNGGATASKKPNFGQDLVEMMNLALAHRRAEIKLERVMPKHRSSQAAPKQRGRPSRRPWQGKKARAGNRFHRALCLRVHGVPHRRMPA